MKSNYNVTVKEVPAAPDVAGELFQLLAKRLNNAEFRAEVEERMQQKTENQKEETE